MELDLDQTCKLCEHVIPCLQNLNLNLLKQKMKPSEMYKLIYNVYLKEKGFLNRQDKNIIEFSLEELITHYENHEIDLHSCIYADLHTARQMQRVVQDQMYKNNGELNHQAIKTWSALSVHKVLFFSKLEKGNTDYKQLLPYKFN